MDTAVYVGRHDLFGQVGSDHATDANGNGVVELVDYQLWQAGFGKTAIAVTGATGSFIDSAAVSEPQSPLLLTLIAASASLKRRSDFRSLRV